MGRHSTPDSTADLAGSWTQWLPEHDRRIGLGAVKVWHGAGEAWRGAPTKLRMQVGALVALPVLGIVLASHSQSSEPPASPSAAASAAGAAYGNQMREAGYNSTSIDAWCITKSGGYSGDQMQAYQAGCGGVGIALEQNGG